MNGRNRHNKYRKSVYQRKSIGTVLISVGATLLVVFIVLTVIGGILHRQSIRRHEQPESTDSDSGVLDSTNANVSVSSLNAYHVLLETTDSTVFSQRLDAIKEKGALFASIPLNDENGVLLYKSENASALGFDIGASRVPLSSAVEAADQRNVYLSGVYRTDLFEEENKLVRNVELSRIASIIAEILESGFDDVVIVAPQLTPEHVDEIGNLMINIRALTSKGAVGITVTDAVFQDGSAAEIMNKLGDVVDFIALDATKYGDVEPAEYVSSKINSENMLYLHMYNVRLLLPYFADATAEEGVINAAAEGGIKNWQIVGLP